MLYFDTDSIIYVHKPDLWNPTIGDKLGEWTDEVPDARIVKIFGMGPKNYGHEYVEKDGTRKSTCEVKGLTFRDNTVESSIPDYFENKEPPIICYKYNKPIRSTIFNFNKLVADLDIDTKTPDS